MKTFLLEHDRRTGETLVRQFHDKAEAFAELRVREAAKADHEEIVLMFAESEDDLHNTHSRYFYSMTELVRRGWDRDSTPILDGAAG